MWKLYYYNTGVECSWRFTEFITWAGQCENIIILSLQNNKHAETKFVVPFFYIYHDIITISFSETKMFVLYYKRHECKLNYFDQYLRKSLKCAHFLFEVQFPLNEVTEVTHSWERLHNSYICFWKVSEFSFGSFSTRPFYAKHFWQYS